MALLITPRGASVLAEAFGMVVAAVGHALMGVPPASPAALHRAESATAPVAEPRLVSVAAVGYSLMGMPSRQRTALYRAKPTANPVAYRVCMIGAVAVASRGGTPADTTG